MKRLLIGLIMCASLMSVAGESQARWNRGWYGGYYRPYGYRAYYGPRYGAYYRGGYYRPYRAYYYGYPNGYAWGYPYYSYYW